MGTLWRRSTSLFEHSPFFSLARTTNGELDQDDRRALKTAFYNTAALVFVSLIFFICTQVFYILEFCIRPLLWALLLGAVLHPVKQVGVRLIVTCIEGMTESGVPMVLGAALLPLYSLQKALQWGVGVTIATYREMVVSLLLILLVLVTDCVDLVDMVNEGVYWLDAMTSWTLDTLHQNSILVWTLGVGYLLLVALWWNPAREGVCARCVQWGAIPMWGICLATVISYCGVWRDTIAVCASGIFGCGTFAFFTDFREPPSPSIRDSFVALDSEKMGKRVGIIEPAHSTPIPRRAGRSLHGPTPFVTPATHAPSRFQTPATSRRPLKQGSVKFLENNSKVSSERYFIVLAWTVLFTLMGREIGLVGRLVCILVLLLAAAKLYQLLQITDRVKGVLVRVWVSVSKAAKFKVLFPQSLRGLAILLLKGQSKVLELLGKSINQVVSASIVLLMILGCMLASCFVLYTVHGEVLYLLKATSLLVDTHTSEHLKNLQSSGLTDWSVGLSSAHGAGRSWIKGKMSTLPEGQNTKDLEDTLLNLYDNMYQQWVSRNVTSSVRSNVTISHLLSTVKGNINTLDVFSLSSLKSNLVHLVSGTCSTAPEPGTAIANHLLCSRGMVVEVLNSLWALFGTNMALLAKLLFSLASGIVEGGAAFLNFIVQLVVFITALYYLLLYSDAYYAPVEIMTSLLPTSTERAEYTSALFDATRGIFGASLKLSTFYSCYVWVLHTLFGLEIVFVPALLAGLLSLVPVVGVYWASLPGALVLWLLDGRLMRSVAFLTLQVLPSYVIDMAVYSEIEGGWHPYITGLAVAGGIYYFGLEGAIIGPLVICILKFLVNLYEVVFNNMSTQPGEGQDE